MRAKEYLRQIYVLDRRINSGLKEISELREMVTCITGMSLEEDKVQKSPSGDPPFVKALSRIWELEARIDDEVDRFVDLKMEIRNVISQVGDCDQQMILRYRYIHFYSWEDIADQMGYGLRWIHILHGKALGAVDRILAEKILKSAQKCT